MKLNDKKKGALYGVACGDTLGATLEFRPKPPMSLNHREIIGGGVFKWEPGQFTDDTEMTLCVANGIIRNHVTPLKYIGVEFVKWYKTGPIDVGATIASSIGDYLRFKNWEMASRNTHVRTGRSAGNGALMRTIPVALAYYRQPKHMYSIAAKQSKLTHYDFQSAVACQIYCEIIRRILTSKNDLPKMYIVTKSLMEIEPNVSRSELLSTFWERLYTVDKLDREQVDATGYVLDSLEAALWAFINFNSFEECVVQAVNLCNDADTVGAITGGLAGAYYGYSKIPERWLVKLQNTELLDTALEGLVKVSEKLT